MPCFRQPCWITDRLAALLLLAAASFCAAPAPAFADENLLPGIIGKDDRVPVADNGPPWGAIGQVNIAGYRVRSACTGTLVAPRVVLTAAHCVFDAGTRKLFRTENIRFVAGVLRDTSLGTATASCVKLPPGITYVGPRKPNPDIPRQSASPHDQRRDLAVIVLGTDLPKARPLGVARPEPLPLGTEVTHAAYPADRRYMLSAHRGCHVLTWTADFIMTDCDSHFGSSGGPLLWQDGGTLKVIGVLSGIVEGAASMFIPLSSWADLPLDATCP